MAITGASTVSASPTAIADAVWSNNDGEALARHTPKYTGKVWYADSTGGASTNNASQPDLAIDTIGGAIGLASAGDRIIVRSGTYSEAGFEMPAGKDGLEIICEHGTLLTDSGSSTQTMLITGNSCVFSGEQVTESGQIGVKVAGNNCRLDYVISGVGNTVAFDIDGAG